MVMAPLLQRYSDYLDVLDEHVQKQPPASDESYVDLLSPAEAVDLCIIRDAIVDLALDSAQRREIDRLDELLIKHARVVAENLPPSPVSRPADHWWWHLEQGAQVRQQASPNAAGGPSEAPDGSRMSRLPARVKRRWARRLVGAPAGWD